MKSIDFDRVWAKPAPAFDPPAGPLAASTGALPGPRHLASGLRSLLLTASSLSIAFIPTSVDSALQVPPPARPLLPISLLPESACRVPPSTSPCRVKPPLPNITVLKNEGRRSGSSVLSPSWSLAAAVLLPPAHQDTPAPCRTVAPGRGLQRPNVPF